MKNILIIILIFFGACTLKSQSIRITVNEKTPEGVKPLANTKFEITLNDTIKTELTTGSDGILGKIALDPGVYKLLLVNNKFSHSETKDIVVSDKKLTAVTVICTPVAVQNHIKKKTK
ncbi:MAG: hypothetical protein JWO32_1389 [Bacteroidetes bacterium]|nr:hypothetical protein [Bacteroidota bacterium]